MLTAYPKTPLGFRLPRERGGGCHKVAGCPGTWTWLVRNLAVSAAQSGGKTRRHLRRFMKSRRYPHDRWLETYGDHGSAVCFKKWLRLVFNPQWAHMISKGYSRTPMYQNVGFMTYRYLRLYTRDASALTTDHRLQDIQLLCAFDAEQNILDFTIKNENLEKDLVQALTLSGYEVTEDMRREIVEGTRKRHKVSNHRAIGYYYDSESVEWVSQRERFLIEKYGYDFP